MDLDAFMKITKDFTNPVSKNFMNIDFPSIARTINQDSLEHPITPEEAIDVSRSLSFLSKLKERRMLRGKKRKDSHRMWVTHGPNHLLLADLAFTPNLSKNSNKKTHHILLVSFSLSGCWAAWVAWVAWVAGRPGWPVTTCGYGRAV